MAILRCNENSAISLELALKGWLVADVAPPVSKSAYNLDRALSCKTSLSTPSGSVQREGITARLEEALDLLQHLNKLLVTKEEEEFEWSTLEGGLEFLEVLREGESLRVTVSLQLLGVEESGNAQVQLQFASLEGSMKLFAKELSQELSTLLGGKESYEQVVAQLESKVKRIRDTGKGYS